MMTPFILSIMEALQREGLYLSEEASEVKTSHIFEEKAIRAANEALRQLIHLAHNDSDLSLAARTLEKIQIAQAEAERAAFIMHRDPAKRCSYLAHRMTSYGRGLFHELKERLSKKKAA